MRPVEVFAPKGGVGATLLVAGLAVRSVAYGHEPTVFDVAHIDQRRRRDVAVTLGYSINEDLVATNYGKITIDPLVPGTMNLPAHTFVDAGHTPIVADEANPFRVLVVRNDYLCLRTVLHSGCVDWDWTVIVDEPGRALSCDDTAQVLDIGESYFTLPFDPAISRAVDAGLLSSRLPRPLHVVAGLLLTEANMEVTVDGPQP